MPKLHRPVTYKKEKGSVMVTSEAVTFQGDEDDDGNEGLEEEWPLDSISKCMANPPTADKAMLKLVLHDSSVKPPMLTFTNRAKLDACKTEIKNALTGEAVGASTRSSSGVVVKSTEYDVDAEQVVPVVKAAPAVAVAASTTTPPPPAVATATAVDVSKTSPAQQQTASATNTYVDVQGRAAAGSGANACCAGAMGGVAGIVAVVCCCICIYVVLPLVIWAILAASAASTASAVMDDYSSYGYSYGNRYLLFQEDANVMQQVEQNYYDAFANQGLSDG